MPFRAVKGMNDVLPEEVGRWQHLEATFRETVALYGYQELRTPIVEETQLFVRSIGEATDVVEKEMYTFERHRESLTLRPEGTAGAARAYVEHARQAKEPVSRLYYIGPMFRAERPQRGRYRQFHQAGCEVYGDKGPYGDAEMIGMLVDLLTQLGIGDLRVAVNSIGGAETRELYRLALLEYFMPQLAALSDHAQARLQINPLRLLDSKDPRDIAVAAGAPSILELLTPEDQEHWDGLRRALDALKTPYTVEPGLVRGLDYYTRTLFEVSSTAGDLGSQNALAGGGRYDAMVRGLGGPEVPAIGFAMGLERLLLAMPDSKPSMAPFCFFAPLGAAAAPTALALARELRERGFRAEVDGRGTSLKSQLRRADALGARLVVVLGESEIERQVAQVKDLAGHSQREVPFGQLAEELVMSLQSSVPSAERAP